jgi:hypothetical protein
MLTIVSNLRVGLLEYKNRKIAELMLCTIESYMI